MGHSCIWIPSAICKGESRWWTHCRRAVCNVHRQMPGQVCGCSTEADSESVCGFDSRPRNSQFWDVAKFGIALDLGSRDRRFESCHSNSDATEYFGAP